ncbi:MAG: group II intron maturase-specific domain-containing protein, partial [Saprospiraceae bacterium]
MGYKYVPTYIKGDKGKYQLVVSDKGWINLKRKLKEITKKSAPKSFDVRIQQIKEASQGWLQYFRLGSIYGKLRDVDSWVRNRLRLCIWNDWKKPERKRKNLIRLGVEANQAYAFNRTRKGKWAIAQSPIMTIT